MGSETDVKDLSFTTKKPISDARKKLNIFSNRFSLLHERYV